MGQFFEEIPGHIQEWILKQQMFWVASAPLSTNGHVNISPKAIEGTFHIVNSQRVWYEDLSGSGAETVAHIRENGRVTILFHAFEGPARIVRLYGKGFFHEIGTPEYDALIGPTQRLAGSRAIIGLDVEKVGTTCGYAVPYYQFLSHRTQLMTWAARKEAKDNEDIENDKQALLHSNSYPVGTDIDDQTPINPNGMRQWWLSHNLLSLDGLPAFSANLMNSFPLKFRVIAKHMSTHMSVPTVPTLMVKSLHTSSLSSNGGAAQSSKSHFRIQAEHLGISYPFDDVFSLAVFVFPYLIVFLIGISIGRISNYSRCFSINLHDNIYNQA